MGVGVNHSGDEASNDRGAKGWQIETCVRGEPCPYTANMEKQGKQNSNA